MAPIALFTYNRPEHTRRTVESLARNQHADQSALIIFSDGPKSAKDLSKVNAVRNYLRSVSGFRSVEIVHRSHNRGLAQSIISGVTEICRQYGRVIVLEDDLVTSPFFLHYMNEALRLYENRPDVISIHGYVYPVRERLAETFFVKDTGCLGWATWQRGWELFNSDGSSLLAPLETRGLTRECDYDGTYPFTAILRDQIAGKNDSWAIRWYAAAFLCDRLTLYPGRSLVSHIGNDGSGTHCRAGAEYDVTLTAEPINVDKLHPHVDIEARAALERCFREWPHRSSPASTAGSFSRYVRRIFSRSGTPTRI